MSKFKATIDTFADIPEHVVRGGVINLFNNIVKRTPVDTGRARGNWFTSISAPSRQVTESTSEAASYAGVSNYVSTWDVSKPIYITNNLPYIMRLEYGSSKQAPAGWVRNTTSQFQKIFENAARGAK